MPISPVNALKAGFLSKTTMTTRHTPVAIWTALRCNVCWPTLWKAESTSWWFTKIDRLTRSLMDFTKMIEVFERHGVSFVSVTQQFNTTNSMGRLMLNILLSFAQFEREVTGERIRDKITASKKKGLNELDFPCVRRQNHISVIRICSCSNPGVRPLLN